jgi:predicted metal-dependent peptidase
MSSADGRLDARKLAAARVFAASRYPYLAAALFAARVQPALNSGTVAIDGRWCIHADPEIVEEISAPELGRLIVHLVSHVLREHGNRALAAGVDDDNGDPEAWNRATDAEINDDLAPNGMVPDRAPELPGDFGAEEGCLAEHYYELARGDVRRWDCGSGDDGLPRPWDSPDDTRQGVGVSERDGEWLRLAVASELQRAEALEPGTVAAGWMRWAEQLLPSKTDWRRVLAAEMHTGVTRAMGMVDYSYRRPSRRAESSPSVVLPSLERPVPDVAIVCDTSGSMSGELLGQVLAEVESLLQRVGLRDAHVRVLSCDAQVHSVRRVSRASQIELLGGGGTDMGEGIAQAVRLRPRPSIVVVLTDGMTPWPDDPPRGVRVVVGLLGMTAARGFRPFGAFEPPTWARVVKIDDVNDR